MLNKNDFGKQVGYSRRRGGSSQMINLLRLILTVNYSGHLTISNLSLALENHKLNNGLCETEYKSFQGKASYSITQRSAVT